MKVIFKDGSVRDAADGYARNYLIPRGLAEMATPERLLAHERGVAKRAAENAVRAELLRKTLGDIDGKIVTLAAKANEKGNLFAAVGAGEMARAVSDSLGADIPESMIEIGKEVKEIGDHPLTLRGAEAKAEITLRVQPLP